MTALYIVAQEYNEAARKLADLDLDEQTVSDTLESLSGELELKAQNVGYFVRNLEVAAEAIKAHEQAQRERRQMIERRVERIKAYISRCMQETGITKIEGPGIVLSFRKSTAVVIDSEGLIPAEYMRVPEPPPPEPNKKAIADSIKAGVEVPGAHLETRQNIQIK